MNANATLALPRGARGLRHPAWYVPLLLPVIPFLASLVPRAAPPAGVTGVFLLNLLGVGLCLSLGLPLLIERLGRAARKEADLLRGAWLASLFVGQVSILVPDDDLGLGVMFFAATAAMMGALTFGAEYQHQTLAGLLSQPVSRRLSWQTKMGTLAVALTLHWLVFGLSRLAMGRTVTPWFALITLVSVMLAWGTTPWWTLVMRGLLSGLVFSLAIPLVALTVYSLVVDVSAAADLIKIDPVTRKGGSVYVLALFLAPAYAVAGAVLGYRRWLQMEAPDSLGNAGGWLGLPRLFGGEARSSGRRSVARQLIFKELHLQAPSLTLGGVALVLAMGIGFLEPHSDSREMVSAAFILVTGLTVVLSGAVTVAEERRLGTLEGQLLLPASRWFQWIVKVGVALGLAALVAWLMVARLGPPEETLPPGYVVTGILVVFFIPALLASSAVAHPLRAVIAAVAMCALVVAGAALATALASQHIGESVGAMYDEARNNPDTWKSAAAALSQEEVDQLNAEGTGQWRILMLPRLVLVALVPGALALLLAARNFFRPAGATRQLRLQFGLCLILVLAVTGGWAGIVMEAGRRDVQRYLLIQARNLVDMLGRISPHEKELWKRYHSEAYTTLVRIPLLPGDDTQFSHAVSLFLPLNPVARRQLILMGDIPADLREALRQEAQAKGEDLTPPPPSPAPKRNPPKPGAAGPIQMDPALMRRYGLTPSPTAAGPPPKSTPP